MNNSTTRSEFPLGLFAVQLVLNVDWSWIFLGLHRPGWLMVPYLAWVSIAGVLNDAIWRLN